MYVPPESHHAWAPGVLVSEMEGEPGMNIFKTKTDSRISAKQEYLHKLGKYLLLFLPANQVLEILGDYQEYISEEEEKASMEQQWGTPGQVGKVLLEENPQAKRYFCQWLAIWTLVLVLTFLWTVSVRQDMFAGLILVPVFAFGFLHGPGQLMVEHSLSIKAGSPKGTFLLYLFLTAVLVLLEIEIQCIVKHVGEMPAFVGGIPTGTAIDIQYAFFQLVLVLLMIWMAGRAATVSIGYLLDVGYPWGVMLFIAYVRNCLHRMMITEKVGTEFLFPVLYGGIGLAMAMALRLSAGRMGRYGLWTHR